MMLAPAHLLFILCCLDKLTNFSPGNCILLLVAEYTSSIVSIRVLFSPLTLLNSDSDLEITRHSIDVIHYKNENLSKMEPFWAFYCVLQVILHLVYTYAQKKKVVYIRIRRVPKIAPPFFTQPCNSKPHKHLELLFISFCSVSGVEVQWSSSFHPRFRGARN